MTKNFQKIKPLIYYGIAALVFIIALISFGLLIKIGLYPYQHEVREGAPLAIVSLILKGINPYSFDVMPAYTYVYGILYPLFALPLSFLFGIDISHLRIVNIFFSFASVALLLSVVPKNQRGLTHYLWASALFIGLLQKNIYAFPSAVGLFFMLASVLIPYKQEYSKKSLILSALLAILGFYAKPYFLIGAGYTAATLFLFNSKKTSLIYFAASITAWVLSLFIMHLIFPVYLANNLFNHLGTATYTVKYMLSQLLYFITKEPILLIFYILGIVPILKKIPKKEYKLSFSIKTPLLPLYFSPFLFDIFALIGLFLFIIKLGGHDGSLRAFYLYDLAYPFIFLSICLKTHPENSNFRDKLLAALSCLLILLSYFPEIYINYKKQENYRIKIQEQKIEALIDPSKNILNSADLASIFLKKNMPLNDSGQSSYFYIGSRKGGKIVYGSKIHDTDQKYKALVAENIYRKKYDYVFISWLGNYSLPEDLTNYYQLSNSYGYPSLWIGGQIELWTPIAEPK